MQRWLIGLANAGISGFVSGAAGMTLGIGWKNAAILFATSAAVSITKWLAQHPIPGAE